mgnify:CR=1 FL=1
MTIGSCFSGIGGLELGLEMAGFGPVLWQIEKDDYCRRVLEKHWPGAERYEDIKAIDWRDMPRPDLICGGPPCQPVSNAGKQLAQGDERWLWPHMFDAIRTLRPRIALIENVPGVLVHGGRDILRDLASCGYDVVWTSVGASHVGAPTFRSRVFFIAKNVADTDSGGLKGERKSEHSQQQSALWNIADGCDSRGRWEGENVGDPVSEGLEVWQGIWGDIATQRATLKRASDRLREFRLTSGRRQWGQDPANDPQSRLGRVAARPADRVFQNQRLMALGNMVVPQVAQFLGEMILGLAKR